MRKVRVLVCNESAYVELDKDTLLSEDSTKIAHMLIIESAPLETWLDVAIAYYELNQHAIYEHILNVATLRSNAKTASGALSRIWLEQRECQLADQWMARGAGKNHPTYPRGMVLCLSSLAAYYVNIAQNISEPDRQAETYGTALKLVGRAEGIMKDNWIALVVRGMIYLHQGAADKAIHLFQSALSFYESRAARSGLAMCQAIQEKDQEALRSLSMILASIYLGPHEPALRPENRLPGASPHFDALIEEVNSYDAEKHLVTTWGGLRCAMAALWERSNEPDRAFALLRHQISAYKTYVGTPFPHKHHTLTLMATILLNHYHRCCIKSPAVDEKYATNNCLMQARHLLEESAKICPNYPAALSPYANLVFLQDDLPKRDFTATLKIARRAYTLAKTPMARSEACYILGRAYHASNDIDAAMKFYTEASTSALPLSRLGLGQLYLQVQNFTQALHHLEALDARYPDVPDIKNIIGAVHLAQVSTGIEHNDAALQAFEQSVKINPKQPDIYIQIAQLAREESPEKTLAAYERAEYWVTLMTENNIQTINRIVEEGDSTSTHIEAFNNFLIPPLDLWNNIGVLRMHLGQLDHALDTFVRVILAAVCSTCGCAQNDTEAGLGSSGLHNLDSTLVPQRLKYSPRSCQSASKPCRVVFKAPPRTSGALPIQLILNAIFVTPISKPLDVRTRAHILDVLICDKWITKPNNVTASFNLALLLETHLNCLDLAQRIHRLIIKAFPSYIHSRLRLAAIDWRMGLRDKAISSLQRLIDDPILSCLPATANELRYDPVFYLTELCIERKDYKQAQVLLEGYLKSQQVTDTYALTQLANLFLVAAVAPSPRRLRNLKFAADFFTGILRRTPGNFFAANGLGIVLALQQTPESLMAATHAFQSAREGAPGLPDTLINLAHVHFVRQDYQLAARLYTNALYRFGIDCPAIVQSNTLAQLARAQTHAGMLMSAKITLMKAVFYRPEDLDSCYYLANVAKSAGLEMIAKISTSLEDQECRQLTTIAKISSEKEQRDAIDTLEAAVLIFRMLQDVKPKDEPKIGYSVAKCAELEMLCTNKCEQAREMILQLTQRLDTMRRIIETNMGEFQAREAERQAEMEKQSQEKQRKYEELQLQADQCLQRTAELQKRWAAEAAEKNEQGAGDRSSGKRKRLKKLDDIDDGSSKSSRQDLSRQHSRRKYQSR